MHRVRRTKHPSLRQIKNMSENLRAKYQTFASIQALTYSFESGNITTDFWISVAGSCGLVSSWPDLIDRYKQLMRE